MTPSWRVAMSSFAADLSPSAAFDHRTGAGLLGALANLYVAEQMQLANAGPPAPACSSRAAWPSLTSRAGHFFGGRRFAAMTGRFAISTVESSAEVGHVTLGSAR